MITRRWLRGYVTIHGQPTTTFGCVSLKMERSRSSRYRPIQLRQVFRHLRQRTSHRLIQLQFLQQISPLLYLLCLHQYQKHRHPNPAYSPLNLFSHHLSPVWFPQTLFSHLLFRVGRLLSQTSPPLSQVWFQVGQYNHPQTHL